MAQADQDTRCHLLSLPAELRNRIYEFALIRGDPIDMATWALPPQGEFYRKYCRYGDWSMECFASEPCLPFSCKQVRSEGLPIYFGSNTFDYTVDHAPDEGQTWKLWLQRLTPEKCNMLRCVRIRGFGWTPKAWETYPSHNLLSAARVWCTLQGNVIRPEALYFWAKTGARGGWTNKVVVEEDCAKSDNDEDGLE